ncbi:LysR family transcriptional regulator [Rhizobium cauense]|uniref:LysR substrate-binding domain-containing protein n=1 Tax=Rhizobium cauense TaxID=1166683 RepID=UPI001C6F5752|nr:LysR substrate-binding domain-containing protein [Rhizobium cauense]MBW9116924.1 LysR family transcriptional regulator [Rhizobium cauense]
MEVVDSGSVTRTAARLNLTQSAVSHHIAQLERFVGGRLFERTGKTLKPYAKARVLASDLQNQLRSLSVALESARRQSDQHDLHIVVTPELYRYWLARRLDQFVGSHPDISLRVSQDYRRDVFTDGNADVQIRMAPPGAGEEGFTLFTEDEFAVCSPELLQRLPPRNAFAAAPFLSHSDVYHTKLDWRRWISELFGMETESWLSDKLGDIIVLPTFEDMLDVCRDGGGFALVRSVLVTDEIASGRLAKAFTETLSADVNYHLIYQRHDAPRYSASLFINWLRKEANVSF